MMLIKSQKFNNHRVNKGDQVVKSSSLPFLPYKPTDNRCKRRRHRFIFNPIIKEIGKILTFPVPLKFLSVLESFLDIFSEQTVNKKMIDILCIVFSQNTQARSFPSFFL
jgi:hypothetical protein